VIVLDDQWHESPATGDRDRLSFKAWVMEARKTTPKDELYPQVRRWYAKTRAKRR